MLVVEIGVFGNTVSRLSVGILIGYSIICVILYGLALYLANRAGWGIADSYMGFVLLGTYFWLLGYFLVTRFGRFLEAVPVADLRTALKLYVWVYAPALLASVVWCCAEVLDAVPEPIEIPGLRQVGLENALRLVALIASVTWVLVSAPIARLWATNRAQDPQALLRAENLLFIDKRQRDFEARVSIASYYALILSILAMLFLVLDSIIGELFERLTGISGYIGAVIASAIVATLLYPVRKRSNAFVTNLRVAAQENGQANTLNDLKSAIESTHNLLKADGTAVYVFAIAWAVYLLFGG